MQERLEAFRMYVEHHVLHHWGTMDAVTHSDWLSSLGHNALAIFHFDAVMVFVVVAVLALLGVCARRSIGRVPRGLGLLMEKFVIFIRDEMVEPNFGGKGQGRGFIPFFCTLFLFILVANLLGLIPLFSCATGNINVTGALAVIFFALALGATVRHGGARGLFQAFMPKGLPGPLGPIMFVMEIVSFFTRTGALMIRLFANMMGGHIMLYIMAAMTAIVGLYAAPTVLVASCLYFFELFVACLQAYVFTMLAAVFIGMMVHPQH